MVSAKKREFLSFRLSGLPCLSHDVNWPTSALQYKYVYTCIYIYIDDAHSFRRDLSFLFYPRITGHRPYVRRRNSGARTTKLIFPPEIRENDDISSNTMY